jgi:hypothetical protein
MAEACVVTSNNHTNIQGKPEDIIEMNTCTSYFKAERSRSIDPELAIDNTYAGKKFLKILCVGDYSGGWSKGVYIEDYRSSDGTISENPNNFPVIGGSFSTKCLYDKSGKEIRLKMWNVPENERFFPTNRVLYRNSDAGIVFWGAKSDTMECALKFKREITQIEPDIPFVFVVDNVFQTPARWMGEGMVMNSPEEMDSFCLEHGFFAWYELLERAGGEKSVFGQAMRTLINEIIFRNKHHE